MVPGLGTGTEESLKREVGAVGPNGSNDFA